MISVKLPKKIIKKSTKIKISNKFNNKRLLHLQTAILMNKINYYSKKKRLNTNSNKKIIIKNNRITKKNYNTKINKIMDKIIQNKIKFSQK